MMLTVMLYLPRVPSPVAEESDQSATSSRTKEVAEELVQRSRDVTRGPVLVVNGVSGQPAPDILVVPEVVVAPLLVVRVKGRGRETQFLQEQNAPEIGKKHVTFLDVVPLIVSMSGLPGPDVIAA